jgi:transcriptional regulator with XRE-family HTH domain
MRLQSYGERFRACRQRAGLTQEQVAKRLRYRRAAPVSLLERKTTKVPRAKTIKKHAAALGCHPWELLAGVATEYDPLRFQTALSTEELAVILWTPCLNHADRRAVLGMMQSFVSTLELPRLVTRPRSTPRAIGLVVKAPKNRRGTIQV